jgi:hypothetical protein
MKETRHGLQWNAIERGETPAPDRNRKPPQNPYECLILEM